MKTEWRRWLDRDPDPLCRQELRALIDAGDLQELAGRFSQRLQFGTAGLRGVVGAANQEEGQTYLRRERAHGRFHRQIQLPYEIDADDIDAQLDNGILRVRLPRAESDRPRKIEVRCGSRSERRS